MAADGSYNYRQTVSDAKGRKTMLKRQEQVLLDQRKKH
jgi:hypothetical protein